MEKIIRKSIAFEKELLKKFDSVSKKKGYKNRSEAMRDAMRKELAVHIEKNPDSSMIASLTFSYNHHEHNVQHELTHLQHDNNSSIRSGLHVHMSHDSCLEVLILEGKVREIKKLADAIEALKGVKMAKLALFDVG